MSKLSFRARALDASKPMPIYLAEELPDLPDYSAINRAVPQMPSGMEKEEECEHHLQRAICAGLIIPTPEVAEMADPDAFDRLYPSDYRMPRQLIHMQPLGLEQDVPDYDMDSEDEKWLKKQQIAAGARRSDLTELKFEETMERLERGSGQTVVTLREARALAGRTGPADHLLAAVYDYWLNKRLATQQPLLLAVRTEARPGAPAASPYLAFRRRTEKMQTRKNRKNDESSYEKMVKLRRELSQAVSLLELIKKREKMKREMIRLAAALTEKRYAIKDFNGHLLAEAAAARVAVAPPLLAPPYIAPHHRPTLDPANRQREKRQYKRRKHRHHSSTVPVHTLHHVGGVSGSSSSSEGEAASVPVPDPCGPFAFRRKPGCQYHMPTASFGPSVEVPWRSGRSKENTSPADPDHRFKYSLTSLSYPTPRFIGLARRRLGRGGRVILDRITSPSTMDQLWATMDYTLTDSNNELTNKRLDSDLLEKTTAEIDTVKVTQRPVVIKQEPADTYGDVTIGVKRERIDDQYECHSERIESVSGRVCVDDNRIRNSDGPSLDEPRLRPLLNDERLRPSVEDDDDLKASSVNSIISKYANLDRIVDKSDSVSKSDCSGGKFSWTAREGSRREQIKVLDEDVKWVTEMLVKRGLRKRLIAGQGLDRAHIDNVLKDCIHFRPQSPSAVSPNQPILTPQNPPDPHENEVKLTKHAPITVHVRLALPENTGPQGDKPSDILFRETASPYVSSEFTLADLYGDSLLPDTEILNINTAEQTKVPNCWGHTNGPEQPTTKLNSWNDVFKASLMDDANNVDTESASKAASFKADLSENSSSNHTSVFISSEGPPSSYSNSECDSNHALATNGLNSEWNDSNGSDRKFKSLKLNHDDDEHQARSDKRKRSSDCIARLGSSVFKMGVNNILDERIFLTAEKVETPAVISIPEQSSSNKSLVNVSQKTSNAEQKRIIVTSLNDSGTTSSVTSLPIFQVKNQGSTQSSPSLVQVRTNSTSLVVNNSVNNIHSGGNKLKDIRSQIVMRGTGGSFQLANAAGQTASIVQVSGASAGLSNANVRQLVQHQRKVVQEASVRRNQDEQVPIASIASFVPSNQSLTIQGNQNQKRSSPQPSHQVVTVSIPPEALKLRLSSDLLALVPRYKTGVTGANVISKDGLVTSSPRRAVVQLPSGGSTPSGLHPKQVKLLHARPLTTSLHRSRIITTHQHSNQTLHNAQQQHHVVQHSVGGTVTGRPVQFRGMAGLLQVQVRSPHHSHNNNRHQRMYAAAQPDTLENASPQLVESISTANPTNAVTPQTSQTSIITAAIGTTTSSPASTANINNITMGQAGKGGGGGSQQTGPASQGSANNNNAAASRKGQAPPLPMEVT